MTWFLPRPHAKYMERAWEKNPLAKEQRDLAAHTEGNKQLFQDRDYDYIHGRLCFEYGQAIELRATLYALWLEHIDDKRDLAQQIEETNQQAWDVLRKVRDAKRRGRKTVRIADLMEGDEE